MHHVECHACVFAPPWRMLDHKSCLHTTLLGLLIVAHLSRAANMSAWFAVGTWQHHLLIRYYHAALAVILAQFSHKGFTDGMAGVIELAEASSYLQVSNVPSI